METQNIQEYRIELEKEYHKYLEQLATYELEGNELEKQATLRIVRGLASKITDIDITTKIIEKKKQKINFTK